MNVKWYFSPLISPEGFNVYRKESNSPIWRKLNESPILYKNYKPTNDEYLRDKELKVYEDLASKPENIKALPMLAVVIKSFKTSALCKYLGIWYEDKTVESGKNYEYKICTVIKNTEGDSAFSSSILAGKYLPIEPPENITYKKGNKKVSFSWLPEPQIYFGVNIYRQTQDSGNFQKITKDPIILSKAKNKEGKEIYGEEFFIDSKLKSHTKYNYFFEAIDFFGSPSKRSQVISITLQDLDPPKAPDSVWQDLNGKRVLLKWKKKSKEDDLLGYNIYRTTHNDTDFTKLNASLITKNDSVFLDSVKIFGSYMYAVSSVDQDLNETISNPYFIEIYDNEAPAKPKNLIIQPDSGRLHLSWDKNTERDLKGYLIYRTINKNNKDTYVKITPRPLTDNYYEDVLEKNIKNNFLYKILAVDESLNKSPYSEFAVARMIDVIAPQAPFIKHIRVKGNNQIEVEWLLNVEPDLAGYNIYRKDLYDSVCVFSKINVNTLGRNNFRYTDRNIELGRTYEYFLEAMDSSRNISKPSNVLKVKFKKIEAPNEIKVTKFDVRYNAKRNLVELKWKLINDPELRTKIVYKKKQGETLLSPFSGTLEEDKLTDNDIRKGCNYSYQLRVYNLSGDVFRSETITIAIE